MEVIAATSGITSLLSFGVQVTGGLFELYNTIKNASADLKGIGQDMRALCGVLSHLQEQLGEHSIPGSKKRFSANLKVLTPALDHCQTLFNELQGKIEAANGLLRGEEAASSSEKLKPGSFLKDRFRPIWERAKWPFTKDDFVKIRSRLEDAKSTLNLCLVIILATPQLKSDVGKDNELEREKASAVVIRAFRKQQKAKQRAAAVEDWWPSQVNASITGQNAPSQAASSVDTISRNPIHDKRPRDNSGGDDHTNIERIKNESSIASEENDTPHDELIAWISVASQSGRENTDLAPVAMRVRLPPKEVKAILRDNSIPLMQALSQLNDKQRNWVISQANELGGTLVHVSRWTTTPTETVFGNINLTSLFWITESAGRVLNPETNIEAGFDQINSALKLSRSSRPRFLDGVRRRFKKSAQPQQGDVYFTQESFDGVRRRFKKSAQPQQGDVYFTQESWIAGNTSQLKPELEQKYRVDEANRRGQTWQWLKDQRATSPGNSELSTPAAYGKAEAENDQDDDEDDVPREEGNLVEKLVSEWINVYDEPS